MLSSQAPVLLSALPAVLIPFLGDKQVRRRGRRAAFLVKLSVEPVLATGHVVVYFRNWWCEIVDCDISVVHYDEPGNDWATKLYVPGVRVPSRR